MQLAMRSRILNDEAGQIAVLTGEIESQCDGLEAQVLEMASGVEDSSENFVQAKDRFGGMLLGVSETLIELTAATGVETADTPFHRGGPSTRRPHVSKAFERPGASAKCRLRICSISTYVPVADT